MAVTYEKIELGTVVGPQGIQGVQGVQGPAGPQGPTGPQGPAGGTFTEDEVKEFAKEVSESYGYMKKVADSDLDMNGYDIEKVGCIRSQPRKYSEGFYAYMPRIVLSDLGNPSSALDIFSAYLKKVVELYPNEARFRFEGIVECNGQGTITGYIYSSSALSSSGIPTYSSFFFKPSQAGMAYIGHTTYEGELILESVSTFPYGANATDNRINSMGSNYIRYANGLQICWGTFYLETISFTTQTGNMYFADESVNFLFPQGFISTPILNLSCGTNYGIIPYLYECDAVKVTRISMLRTINGTVPMYLKYIAIGAWK